MNRTQQIAERKRPDGRVMQLSNLNIAKHHLDAEYSIRKHNLARSETGLLRVFDLVPNNPGDASFHARWDDGSPGRRNREDGDFDIDGVSDEIKRDFKNQNPRWGYSGHHTDRSPDPHQRIYDVRIEAPTGLIFEGEVSFNVTFDTGVTESMNATMSTDAVVIPATPWTRFRNRILGLYDRVTRYFLAH